LKGGTFLSQQTFAELDLPARLLQNLDSLGYQSMTPVQSQVLPLALEGKDIVARAKTGSGKTVSFALALLAKLDSSRFAPQALVLCPTRELAEQISEVTRQLARTTENLKVLTLTGGSSTRTQQESLARGAHVIVGTPGRIEDHIRRASLSFENLNTLVLDEADRMLQMGFMEAIMRIIEQLPHERQTLLLSATYPEEIKDVADKVMRAPEFISVDTTHTAADIQQLFYHVEDKPQRLLALQLLLLKNRPESVLIFCNTRVAVSEVTQFLLEKKFSAIALHGDLDQRDRDQNLIRFSNRSVSILVATDVAARGIDIDKLDVVINYELTKDSEVHVHRSGRTGRAGETGEVWTLYDDADQYRIEKLQATYGIVISKGRLPTLQALKEPPVVPPMVTLVINGGKKQKLRPGDILGALTGEGGVPGSSVGNIKIQSTRSFVAVERKMVKQSLERLQKIKRRSFKTRPL
jgi:ATP-independent RNA helicase DbpA